LKILIVAKDNGYGLSVHSGLLKSALESAGFEVDCVDPRRRNLFHRLFGKKRADLAIHVERIGTAWLNAAPKHAFLPQQERFPKRLIGRLKKINMIFAQTLHAEEIFSGLNCATVFTGFMSRDRLLPEIEKNWDRFFHLAGGSKEKGTEDILALWAKHPEWPELLLIQKAANAPKSVPANVTLISGHINDAELQRLQNECGVHLCPSRSEGWGHYLHEAMSSGAVVITTDAPPMNEFITPSNGMLVPFDRQQPRHLGTDYFFNLVEFETAISRVIEMKSAEKQALGINARKFFLSNNLVFLTQLNLAIRKLLASEI
jgi:Glycosyl transferases group 1